MNNYRITSFFIIILVLSISTSNLSFAQSNKTANASGPKLTAQLDQPGYYVNDRPIINISGPPSSTLNLVIMDPFGKEKFSDKVLLGPDGLANYTFNLTSFTPGVYSVIISIGNNKVVQDFLFAIKPPCGQINFSPVKEVYLPGDNVIILGNSNADCVIQLMLLNPSAMQIENERVFSDKNGHFSSSDFKIPQNATSGLWKVKATSGLTQRYLEIKVNPPLFMNAKQNNTNTEIPTYGPTGPITKIKIESPQKQFKSGISLQDVKCNQDLVLVIKKSDNSPACVKPDTAQKLVERGWGSIVTPSAQQTEFKAIITGSPFFLNYKITGGSLLSVHDPKDGTIRLSLNATSDGEIVLKIPRQLDNSRTDVYDTLFFVIIDSKEIASPGNPITATNGTLAIKFSSGAKEVVVSAMSMCNGMPCGVNPFLR